MRASGLYPTYFSIGLMSGTSMDGVDVALLKTDGQQQIQRVAGRSVPYPSDFVHAMKQVEQQVKANSGKIAGLPIDDTIQQSTDFHVHAVQVLLKEVGMQPEDIEVVGYHGQTVFHHPQRGITVQLGDAERLARQTGIQQVVHQFRLADVAAGGQGAPLAPVYHQALLIRDNHVPAAVVNCGGISNVTLVSGTELSDVSGFDAGPGNGLLDKVVRLKTNGKYLMDRDAQFGRQGQVHKNLLAMLREKSCLIDGQNYFDLPVPKSLDINDFILLPEVLALSLEDACTTLAMFTAQMIIDSVRAQVIPCTWVLAGGGWHNPLIQQFFMQGIQQAYGAHIHVVTAEQIGWHTDTLEAELFAYLAVRRLHGLPATGPSITGAQKNVICGEFMSNPPLQPKQF